MNHLEKYYKILKLKPGASLGEVKQAYRDLAKVWHPDCFPDAPDLKQKAEEEIKKINEAYQQLKSCQPVSPHSSSGDQTANYSTYRIDAETYYKRGMENAKKARYTEAIEDFTSAIRLNPEYIEAYQYRRLACSKLGYENRAASDANKAAQLQHKQKTQPSNTAPYSSSSWKCDRTLKDHVHWVFSIAISPDGQTLVSSSADKTIRIWHLATGKLLNTLTGHLEFVRSVAISPDGNGTLVKVKRLLNKRCRLLYLSAVDGRLRGSQTTRR